MKLVILILSVMLSFVNAATLQEYLDYSKGKSLYEKENYDEAETVLKSALEHGEEPGKIYRALGDVAYQKNDYEQALKFYDQSLLTKTEDDDVDIYFNKGNSYLNQQQFDKAAEEYKNVLAKSPNDQSAKKNLEIALRLIQQQQEQQQQQNDPNSKKDDDKQDQKDQEKEQDKQDPDKNKDQQNEDKGAPEPQNLEEEQAKQILKMIEESESDIRKKYRKKPESKGTIGNDW